MAFLFSQSNPNWGNSKLYCTLYTVHCTLYTPTYLLLQPDSLLSCSFPRQLSTEAAQPILPARCGPQEQLSGTPKRSKIWLSGTSKWSKIWLSGTPKRSKIWLSGTPKWSKISILKKIQIHFLGLFFNPNFFLKIFLLYPI